MIQIGIDGIHYGVAQPQRMMWNPPRKLGNDGLGSPVYAPYWSAELSFHKLQCFQFVAWNDAADGDLHDVWLPHPITGEMIEFNCYVEILSPRLNTSDLCGYGAAVSGVDIAVTRLEVA